uniref:Uncharacterized protein n=1 Tax=Mycena chlorophos TaxID=658473 RepID=A0ABQ0LJN6_MYCCL|nr:predicted protein [Mycena chlorophos]
MLTWEGVRSLWGRWNGTGVAGESAGDFVDDDAYAAYALYIVSAGSLPNDFGASCMTFEHVAVGPGKRRSFARSRRVLLGVSSSSHRHWRSAGTVYWRVCIGLTGTAGAFLQAATDDASTICMSTQKRTAPKPRPTRPTTPSLSDVHGNSDEGNDERERVPLRDAPKPATGPQKFGLRVVEPLDDAGRLLVCATVDWLDVERTMGGYMSGRLSHLACLRSAKPPRTADLVRLEDSLLIGSGRRFWAWHHLIRKKSSCADVATCTSRRRSRPRRSPKTMLSNTDASPWPMLRDGTGRMVQHAGLEIDREYGTTDKLALYGPPAAARRRPCLAADARLRPFSVADAWPGAWSLPVSSARQPSPPPSSERGSAETPPPSLPILPTVRRAHRKHLHAQTKPAVFIPQRGVPPHPGAPVEPDGAVAPDAPHLRLEDARAEGVGFEVGEAFGGAVCALARAQVEGDVGGWWGQVGPGPGGAEGGVVEGRDGGERAWWLQGRQWRAWARRRAGLVCR